MLLYYAIVTLAHYRVHHLVLVVLLQSGEGRFAGALVERNANAFWKPGPASFLSKMRQ